GGCSAAGPSPPWSRGERTRLRPDTGIRFGSGGGDTGILICQLPAYLDETAVELGDFAAAGGAELFLGELDALVDRVRRNPELAADLLGGLVLYQEVEHLALLGRQPGQHEFDLGVLAPHVAPAFSISLPPPRRSRFGPSRIASDWDHITLRFAKGNRSTGPDIDKRPRAPGRRHGYPLAPSKGPFIPN